jgi:hypothetical protein
MFPLDVKSWWRDSRPAWGVLPSAAPTGSRTTPRQYCTANEHILACIVAAAMAAVDDDDEYEIPLRDQRYFGAGLKRKRVRFVASTEQAEKIGSASLPTTPTVSSAADRYLSIVLGQSNTAERASSAPAPEHVTLVDVQTKELEKDTISEETKPLDVAAGLYCDLCRRGIAANVTRAVHESSIAHQISLQHSYPPSHVDRDRKGLAVLQDHGWDPDSRLGLGAKGEGILQPIKAVDNPNKAGVGARLAPARVKEKPVKLDAGKVRRLAEEGKKKAERLRNSFYMSDDVQKYLGDM